MTRVLATAALALALAGCSAAGTPSPTTTPTASATTEAAPAPAPTPTVDVPVRSAELGAAEATRLPAPVSLDIPTLEAALPVDPVGVQADGQMEIPPLAERAGWYRFGATPGDPEGTTVIAAHVDSVASAGTGPFARLGELVPGDVVDVTLADGSAAAYAVTEVLQVPKSDAAWEGIFTRDGPRRLALITCGGTFDDDARRYSDNVIVLAAPVPG